VTLKLHQFLPAQANVPKLVLDVWADNVEAASDGRIKVDRYPSMQLGGARRS
jgi:C4-dicarboxylate-binding protein DctP